jgi:hypothetical protein
MGKKNGGRISGPRPFQNGISGLLGSSGVGRSSSGISSRSSGGVDSSASICSSGASVSSGGVYSSAGSIGRRTGSVSSSGASISGRVNCLCSAFGCHFSSFGRLLGSFGRLFGGLAAAAGNHQQRNWQTKPCRTDRSAHLFILLYPQHSMPRLRQTTFCLISASRLRDTPHKCLLAETGSHPIAAIQRFRMIALVMSQNPHQSSVRQPEAC